MIISSAAQKLEQMIRSFFGDGLKSDILGSENYGLDSIWYNHRHRKNTLNLHPIFEVDNYPQLVQLMQNDFQRKY